jgi:hypothetical protein
MGLRKKLRKRIRQKGGEEGGIIVQLKVRNILYEDGGRRDVCENGERGRERRRGGRKGGSVSVLITKKGRLNVERHAPCPTCTIVVGLMIKSTRSRAFSVALWCTECQDVTLSVSLCT